MGLFTPIVNVDDTDENFGWILQILKNIPSTEELEQKLEELEAACKRAEDAKASIDSVLSKATAAAKAELKNEINTIYEKCVAIQKEVDAAKDAVQKVVDDAVSLAKSELQTAMQTELEKAENAATRAETVVSSAVENLRSENTLLVQTTIDEKLVLAKSELSSEIELAKSNLQTLINNRVSELNTAINNKLTETKQLIEADNKSAVDEVKEYIGTNPFYKRGEFILIPANWVDNRQTVSVPGVKTDSDIIVTHAPNSYAAYIAHGVHCSEVEAGLLRFACETVPTENITVNVMILLRGADL